MTPQTRLARHTLALACLAATLPTLPARADIYEWAWLDPLDPSKGKMQSTIVCGGGAGIDPVPYVDLGIRNLNKAYLINADIHGATATHAMSLMSADLSSANLTSVNFESPYFDRATCVSTNFTSASLIGATFANADLTSATFTRANLTYAGLYSATAVNTNFASATLTRAALLSANLTSANFTSAQLTSANIQYANLTKANLTSAALSEAYLSSAIATSANFTSADLFHATLAYANLTAANFTGANLTSARFHTAGLINAIFANATITAAIFDGATMPTPQQFYATASYQARNLQAVSLRNCYVPDWNFASQNLTSAAFSSANVSYGDFTSANLTSVAFIHADLHQAIFTRANLTSANLLSAWLWHANLTSATLANANFTSADISAATFDGAAGLTAAQLYSTASYQAHNLRFVSFGALDLTGWNFASQALNGAAFVDANLTNANFTSADLHDANLAGANLLGTDLTSANLTFADLRNAAGFSPVATTVLHATILPDASLPPFTLATNEVLTIRPGSPPVAITGTSRVNPGASFNLAADAVVHLAPHAPGGAPNLLIVANFSLTGTNAAPLATLDLHNNALIYQVRPADSLPEAYSKLAGYLKAAAAAGTWTGPRGITSTEAQNSHLLYALGIASNADLIALGQGYTTFDGEPVDDRSILVAYTLQGDTNLDGTLDASDYALLDAAYTYNLAHPSTPLTGWLHGDFNYDGTIDAQDYFLIDHAWYSTHPLALSRPTQTPEPASLALLTLGTLALLRRHAGRAGRSAAAALLQQQPPACKPYRFKM